MKELAAGSIHTGWIYVPDPAAAPGWYHVDTARHVGGWSEFHCGRGAAYTVLSHFPLRWSPQQPVAS